MKFLDYGFLCLIYVATFVLAEDVCVMKSPCKCEFANGTGTDLTPAAKPWFYQVQVSREALDGYDLITYGFHPCGDVQPTSNASITNNSCTRILSLYSITYSIRNMSAPEFSIKNICEFLGASLEPSTPVYFRDDGRALIFTNGPSKSTVELVCGETDGVLTAKSFDDPQNLVLQFVTRFACMEQMEVIPAGRLTLPWLYARLYLLGTLLVP